jgi:hypothetical protein
MNIYIKCILKKIIGIDEISDKIFNIYMINKYFSKNLSNTSIKIFKNHYINHIKYTNIIINTIKPCKKTLQDKTLLFPRPSLKSLAHLANFFTQLKNLVPMIHL